MNTFTIVIVGKPLSLRKRTGVQDMFYTCLETIMKNASYLDIKENPNAKMFSFHLGQHNLNRVQ